MKDVMIQPSLPSTLVFLSIVAFAVCAMGAALLGTLGKERLPAIVAGLFLWLVATGAIAPHLEGVLFEGGPPRLLPFFVALNAIALGFALSPLGGRIASSMPAWALLGFQAFRLPLELILHQWYREGVIPVQMTYLGQNLDIIAGVLALLVAVGVKRGVLGRRALWGANVVGLLLLLNVIRVVVMTSPGPLRVYTDGPPLLLAIHFPYIWIGSICVVFALAIHVILFRKLRLQA